MKGTRGAKAVKAGEEKSVPKAFVEVQRCKECEG